MLPDTCPSTKIIALDARYNPHYHVKAAQLPGNHGMRDRSSSILVVQLTTSIENGGGGRGSERVRLVDLVESSNGLE